MPLIPTTIISPAIAGDTTLIQQIVVPSGGSVTVDFSSIPSTYLHLRIDWLATVEASGDFLEMIFNHDSGVNYNRGEQNSASGNATGVQASNAGVSVYCGYTPSVGSDGAAAMATGRIEIPFYAISGFNRTCYGQCSPGKPISTNLTSMYFSGAWNNTAVINRIEIFRSAHDIAEGSIFRLLGISI